MSRNAININALAVQILSRYDHDRNGVIDLRRSKGLVNHLRSPDERNRQALNVVPGLAKDVVSVSPAAYTMRRLFERADANRDGKVDQRELTRVIRSYDANRDGQLDRRPIEQRVQFWKDRRTEYDRFNREVGERLEADPSIDL